MAMSPILVPKTNITGVDISNICFEELIGYFNATIDHKHKIRVCVTPVNSITSVYRQPALSKIYNSADLVLCDGMPIKWASHFLKTPLKERITGLDVLPAYIAECADRGYSMFFLGASDGVATHLKKAVEIKYPGVQIAGSYTPSFAERFSEEENEKMIEMINTAKPNVLWVSLTAPKQDIWIYEHLHRLNVNIAIGIGGAFEVSAGLIPRAPKWMQRNGLEWFFRFLQEPRRMFRRYFIDAPVFFPKVLQQKWKR